MNPQKWKQTEEIFQVALDLRGRERQEFIERECGADAELRAAVDNYIECYESEEEFLESPVWTDSRFLESGIKKEIVLSLEDKTTLSDYESPFINRQIGAYRLIKKLGKGGMGEVFLAERADGEFKQEVAVKLIKPGMDTDFIVKRFRHERQIAAALNHPNIARLFDGGTTDDDLPYFIMEYVEGKPLIKYCEEKNLDLRQKLELFLQICAAISYAHKRKIIHRDIKPSNILVAEGGQPKLLDFGIAKILDPELIHESEMPTATAMRLMTPEYASPEQVRGDEITEASDQYSLGVLLYELIAGTRPYKFPSRAAHDIARVICEEIPGEPSSGEAGKIASGKSFFDADFAQKLDRIVLKALRKNPRERYDSVIDFAADIERLLRGEQIIAESAPENLRQVSASAQSVSDSAESKINQKSIAVLPLKNLNDLAGASAESSDYLNLGLADALITRLSKVREFIVRPTSSVLRYASIETDSFAAGSELNVAFVLDGNILKSGKRLRVSVQLLNIVKKSTVWAARFDEDLTDVFQLEDSISKRVAESLVPHLSTGEALKLSRRATEDAAAYEAFMRGRVAGNLFTEDGLMRAARFYEDAIQLDPNFAQAYAALADVYVWFGMLSLKSFKECYPLAKNAAEKAIELDANSPEAYASLGLMELYGRYDWKKSEENIRRAIELNPNYAVAHNWFSHTLLTGGKFSEGEDHIRRAITLDPTSFQNHNTQAWMFYFERRFDKALDKANELLEKFPGAAYPFFGKAMFLRFLRKYDESIQNARRAVGLSPDPIFNFYGLSAALASAGKIDEARQLIENSSSDYSSRYHTAIVYCALNDSEKAFELLKKSYAAKEGPLLWLGVDPGLDILRRDARYFALLEKMNHPLTENREAKAIQSKFADFSEQPTQIITQKSIPSVSPFSFGKVLLVIIFAILLGWGTYYFFSHITFTP